MLLKDVDYICKLIYESFNIPITFIDHNDMVKFEQSSLSFKNPNSSFHHNIFKQFNFRKETFLFPLFVKTEHYEEFFIIQIRQENEYKGMIIVGPTLAPELTNDRLAALINDMNVQKSLGEKLVYYFETLPRLSHMKLMNISMQIYYMLYQETLDPAEIILKNSKAGYLTFKIEDPQVTISQQRENVSFHHDFMYEKRLFQFIKEGRKEEFLKIFKISPENGKVGILSKKSQLRHSKNLGITAITLATRAAIEGGLHYEIAYTLSDLYIQSLEELTDCSLIDPFIEQALSEFADRVRKQKQQSYSKPINKCMNYIYTHLYEELTLTQLAELVDMHPNYVSSLFKKEVGMPIAEYIHQTKIDEAKTLLTFTDYSLLKISTILNFHDQSYFTKVFKKYTGITPKKYKTLT